MFPVALLLLNFKRLWKRFVGPSGPFAPKSFRDPKGISPGSATPGCRQPALDFIKNGQIAEAERRLEEIVSSWTFLIAHSITVTVPFSM